MPSSVRSRIHVARGEANKSGSGGGCRWLVPRFHFLGLSWLCMHPLQPHCKNRAISLKSEPGWKLGSIFSDLSQYGSGVTSDPGNSASDLKFDLEMNLAPQI